MTIQVPSTAVDGSEGDGSEIVPNPPVGVKSADFLGTLYNNILLPVGTGIVKAKVEQELAIGAAKAQAKINSYHATDPSIGPNDPKAALAYAAQTQAQRWLPSFMLAPATTVKTETGQTYSVQKVSPFGWAMLAIMGAAALWLFVRLFRR